MSMTTPVQELLVALIVRSSRRTLEEITSAIGIEPTSGHSRGETRRNRTPPRPMPNTSWVLRSDAEATASLELQVQRLTEIVPPTTLRQACTALADEDLLVELDIGVFYGGQCGTLGFPPRLLRLVEEYGASLFVTAYAQTDVIDR